MDRARARRRGSLRAVAASRTGFYDVVARGWWDEALEFAGMPAGLLPEPQLAGTLAGHVSSSVLPPAAGAALQRILALLGVPSEQRDELERAALLVPEGCNEMELLAPGEERMTLTWMGREPSPAVVYRAALEAVGRGGVKLLAAMAEIAGPLRRLVVTGGWAEGEAAHAVKQRHLGPLAYVSTVYTAARGAALAAARAAQLEIVERAPLAGVAGQEES